MSEHAREWMASGPTIRLIALLCAALCAAGCQKAEPRADATPQEKPPAPAPPAPTERPDPWFSASTMTPPRLPDAPEVALSADEEEFKKQVDRLQGEGQLAEVRGTFGPRGSMDARIWTYKGRLVKTQIEATFTRQAELDRPDYHDVREIAVRYGHDSGKRVISDSREIMLWCEALGAGSVVRERVQGATYYMSPDLQVGDMRGPGTISGLWLSSSPSTIEFRAEGRRPLVVEISFEHPASENRPIPKPDEPLVERVESYRVVRPDGAEVYFENPLLDALAERYYLEITREAGRTVGKWTETLSDGGHVDLN